VPFNSRPFRFQEQSCEIRTLEFSWDGKSNLFVDPDFDSTARSFQHEALKSIGHENAFALIGFSPHAKVADGLGLAFRSGISSVVGLIRCGTRTPPSEDSIAIENARLNFERCLPYWGFALDASVVEIECAGASSSVSRLMTAVSAGKFGILPPIAGSSFCCAQCGVPVTWSVSKLAEPLLQEWIASLPLPDESLVPPRHYWHGNGTEVLWMKTRDDYLYFHESDWIDPEDNGSGMSFTCCGARPDPSNGFNLSCPNGHRLGELWTDCCCFQGIHVPISNLCEKPSAAF
jgi:hypothetical protein